MTMFDPFRDLESLRREIDRAFAEVGFGSLGGRAQQAFLPGRAARQYPLVNVHDDGETFSIEALAPGVDASKIDVSVVRNTLTIAGEKPGLKDVPPEKIHRSERAAGRFMRTVELPTDVDPAKISARYEHGLLLLTVPRAESARPRRITVQSN